jgi:hypothetical protein
MSRRKKQAVAGDPQPSAADHSVGLPSKPRPRPWFLALAVLLETAWLAFLLVLALG